MEKQTVDLQSFFVMNTTYMVKFLNEKCFSILNRFIRQEASLDFDPIFFKEENGSMKMGYITPKENGKTYFYSNQKFNEGLDTISKICLVGFVIFEACKTYGCFEKVPMCGAPEEGHNHYFEFTFEGVEYHFKLWTK